MDYCQKLDPVHGQGKPICRYKDLLLPAFVAALKQPGLNDGLIEFMELGDSGSKVQMKHWLTRKVVAHNRDSSNLWRAFEYIQAWKGQH